MSDANRTIDEYVKLYSITHGISEEEARNAKITKEFAKELENESKKL